MNASSSAYVSCVYGGSTYTWHFTGVTAIEHTLALNLDNTSSQGTDIVNGARNQPDQVSLSVVETDTAHADGWAARMLEAMAALKKNRILCRLVTSMGSYDRMLLTEITATQDGDNQDGWSGQLLFTEYLPVTEGTGETVNIVFFQRFPFAVRNGYGEWRWAVFLLEAAALAAIWAAVRKKERKILPFLILFASSGVFLESLKCDHYLRILFVNVSQAFSLLALFGANLFCALKGKDGKQKAILVSVLLLGAAVFAAEFLKVKSGIPNGWLFLVLFALSGGIGGLSWANYKRLKENEW